MHVLSSLPSVVRLGLFALLLMGLAACAGPGAGDAAADGAAADRELPGYTREPALEVGDLSLPNYAAGAAGAPFALRAQEAGLLVLYLGYLSCPDVCPLTMADLGGAIERLPREDAGRVTVAMATIDLERDEGAEIEDYLTHFFDDRVAALRAEHEAAIEEVGERLRATWEIQDHAAGESYDVSHSAQLYLIDDQGSVVRELPFGTDSEAMTKALRALLQAESI